MNKDFTNHTDVFFEKNFTFCADSSWVLPTVNVIFKDKLWHFEELMKLKHDLNIIKSLLNDKGEEWHQHTSYIDKAGYVGDYIKSQFQPELFTQAWCKFWEIVCSFNLIRTDGEHLNSLHLCEAPGGFISALNMFLQTDNQDLSWNWIGNTLNPYYEGHDINSIVVDDRLILPTLKHWYFGEDDTGDITDTCYRDDLNAFLNKMNTFQLVTADGSINCLNNPAEQELVVSDLHLAETIIALQNLQQGGSFVLKKFTFFECITICKLYLLNCAFEKVHVFKPFTSKSGNSEVYLICMGYLGVEKLKDYIFEISSSLSLTKDKAIFPFTALPESFLTQLVQCSKIYFHFQKSAIEENLHLFSTPASEWEENHEHLKEQLAQRFLNKYKIPQYEYTYKRLFSSNKKILSSFSGNYYKNTKIMYFRALGDTYNCLQKTKTQNYKDIVYDIEKRINACFPYSKKRSLDHIEWCNVEKDVYKRMKSTSYKNWISSGKEVKVIENSKFCNPLLLYLWNRISHKSEVNIKQHSCNQICYFDMQSLVQLFGSDETLATIVNPEENHLASQNDPVFTQLKSFFKSDCHVDLENPQCKHKIFFINTLCWTQSLHQEIIIKNSLSKHLFNTLKVMEKGNSLIICIQSTLTRYTVGILFIVLSFFEKFLCLLPSPIAPSTYGQMWVMKNFLKPEWSDRAVNHFENILKFSLPVSKEILQIVPITSLCTGSFYSNLLNLNNKHLLQRIRSLINCEKRRIDSQC